MKRLAGVAAVLSMLLHAALPAAAHGPRVARMRVGQPVRVVLPAASAPSGRARLLSGVSWTAVSRALALPPRPAPAAALDGAVVSPWATAAPEAAEAETAATDRAEVLPRPAARDEARFDAESVRRDGGRGFDGGRARRAGPEPVLPSGEEAAPVRRGPRLEPPSGRAPRRPFRLPAAALAAASAGSVAASFLPHVWAAAPFAPALLALSVPLALAGAGGLVLAALILAARLRGYAARRAPRRTAALTAALAGAAALAAGAHALKMIAALKMFYLLGVAALAIGAVAAVLIAAALTAAGLRRLRGRPVPAPSGARTLRTALAGAAAGMALATAAGVYQQPLIEAYGFYELDRLPPGARVHSSLLNSEHSTRARAWLASQPGGAEIVARLRGLDGVERLPVFAVTQPRMTPLAIRGPFAEELESYLSETPEGRSVLDGLRDRTGVLRLPPAYVLELPGNIGMMHHPFLDAVLINADLVREAGYDPAELARDAALQRRFVREHGNILVHEDAHGVQARRALLNPDYLDILSTDLARMVRALHSYAGLSAAGQRPDVLWSNGSGSTIVSITPEELARDGLSVEDFLSSHASQRDYFRRHADELNARFRTAAARGLPAAPTAAIPRAQSPGYVVDFETEAVWTAVNDTLQRLEQDPRASIEPYVLREFQSAVRDPAAFLEGQTRGGLYETNWRSRSPYYSDYHTRLFQARAEWRLRGYAVLAIRARADGDDAAAADYRRAGRLVAREAGLDVPPVLR